MNLFPRRITFPFPLERDRRLRQVTVHRGLIPLRLPHLFLQHLTDHARDAHVLLCCMNARPRCRPSPNVIVTFFMLKLPLNTQL
jgi:hypothetical protein